MALTCHLLFVVQYLVNGVRLLLERSPILDNVTSAIHILMRLDQIQELIGKLYRCR
jgi:hypothetical protein